MGHSDSEGQNTSKYTPFSVGPVNSYITNSAPTQSKIIISKNNFIKSGKAHRIFMHMKQLDGI